jgi:hypothetical protein
VEWPRAVDELRSYADVEHHCDGWEKNIHDHSAAVLLCYVTIPTAVAARSKAEACGLSLARIARGIDDCQVSIVCCRAEILRWADHSSRGVLPIVVFLSVIIKTDNEEALAH